MEFHSSGDEARRSRAESKATKGIGRSGTDRRMIGETEVIVRAETKDFAPVYNDFGRLRAKDGSR